MVAGTASAGDLIAPSCNTAKKWRQDTANQATGYPGSLLQDLSLQPARTCCKALVSLGISADM
jgi:hypothetical protein